MMVCLDVGNVNSHIFCNLQQKFRLPMVFAEALMALVDQFFLDVVPCGVGILVVAVVETICKYSVEVNEVLARRKAVSVVEVVVVKFFVGSFQRGFLVMVNLAGMEEESV